MSYNKLNEDHPPSYQATAPLHEPPPKYESAYPPQGNYGQQHSTTVITNQPVIVVQSGYGPYSKVVTCPNCRSSVSTSVSHEAGVLTWLASGLICLFGCWFGCCLIPFCVEDLQDCKHSCPSCGHYLGIYRRIS